MGEGKESDNKKVVWFKLPALIVRISNEMRTFLVAQEVERAWVFFFFKFDDNVTF